MDRIGKCVGELAKITEQYDSVNKVSLISGKNSTRSHRKDIENNYIQSTKYSKRNLVDITSILAR